MSIDKGSEQAKWEPMSAIGPKRTFLFAPDMSACGGKAGIR